MSLYIHRSPVRRYTGFLMSGQRGWELSPFIYSKMSFQWRLTLERLVWWMPWVSGAKHCFFCLIYVILPLVHIDCCLVIHPFSFFFAKYYFSSRILVIIVELEFQNRIFCTYTYIFFEYYVLFS